MIQPDIWGPHGWKFMHYISLGYPMNPSENDKLNYKNFYYSLQYVLPCEKCQINYRRNILENPIDKFLKDRKSLTKWVIDIHNKVNQETNKPISIARLKARPIATLSIEAQEMHEKFEKVYKEKEY